METNGHCDRIGASGEKGCFQFLPSTWNSYIEKYAGTTTMPLTPENEYKIMVLANTELAKKYSVYQVALIHNQGHPGKCSSGVNSHGVEYDSCAYAESIRQMVK